MTRMRHSCAAMDGSAGTLVAAPFNGRLSPNHARRSLRTHPRLPGGFRHGSDASADGAARLPLAGRQSGRVAVPITLGYSASR